MMQVEWIDVGDDLTTDESFTDPATYVVDPNGIVAGLFDSEDEAEWWISKCKRVP